MAETRSGHTAVLLGNGTVLVAGGYTSDQGTDLATAEIYLPSNGTWSSTASMGTPRRQQQAVRLPGPRVLIAGGGGFITPYRRTAEIYHPAAGTWTYTRSMITARANFASASSPAALAVGGTKVGFNSLASAEIYDPAARRWAATASMSTARQAIPRRCSGMGRSWLPRGRDRQRVRHRGNLRALERPSPVGRAHGRSSIRWAPA